MSLKLGFATIGSPYSEKKQRESIEKQGALADLQAGAYKDYGLPSMASLRSEVDTTPDYLNRLYASGANAIRTWVNNQMGSALNGLTSTGMMRSGQANNIMAGIGAQADRDMGNLSLQVSQLGDQRKLDLLRMLASLGTGQGAAAAAGYGSQWSQWGQQAQDSMADFNNLLGAAGYLTGLLMKSKTPTSSIRPPVGTGYDPYLANGR